VDIARDIISMPLVQFVIEFSPLDMKILFIFNKHGNFFLAYENILCIE
jgi:hypothetical protein